LQSGQVSTVPAPLSYSPKSSVKIRVSEPVSSPLCWLLAALPEDVLAPCAELPPDPVESDRPVELEPLLEREEVLPDDRDEFELPDELEELDESEESEALDRPDEEPPELAERDRLDFDPDRCGLGRRFGRDVPGPLRFRFPPSERDAVERPLDSDLRCHRDPFDDDPASSEAEEESPVSPEREESNGSDGSRLPREVSGRESSMESSSSSETTR